ncbi:MAG: hypothetical protein IKB75_00650 [Clostridia bacterium]|nr:hypothetical protein [Clostridia bacterium]
MKISVRFISSLLCLVILVCSMSSCFSVGQHAQDFTGEGSGSTAATTGTLAPDPQQTTASTTGSTRPSLPGSTGADPGKTTASTTGNQTPPDDPITMDFRFPYVLKAEEVDEFYEMLNAIQTGVLENKITTDELAEMVEEMETRFYYISTQSQIAYVEYCFFNDEASEENYLYSSGAETDIYTAYMKTCAAIDAAEESALKTAFFDGWTDEDFASMRGYSEELSEYSKISQNILVDYRALTDEEFEDGAAELLMDLVECNEAIAKLEGYDSYLDYAYDVIYGRDYSPEKTAQMRQFVKDRIVPLCKTAYDKFQATFSALKGGEQSRVISLVESDYDRLPINYLDQFLATLPEDAKDAMNGMFDDENVLFSDHEFSEAGAFTGYLYAYETPFCYFGPGYQNLFTMVHELGHYYNYICNAEASMSYDLAELHSQGNEFLLLAYLQDAKDAKVIEAVTYYQVFNALFTVIVATIVDDFETYVYTHADEITDPTVQLDEIMNQIVASYDRANFIKGNADMLSYWRYVTVEHPLYYISYAMSGLMSVELYALAIEDYDAALEVYCAIVTASNGEKTFLEVLADAGLGNPFSEETYARLEGICA